MAVSAPAERLLSSPWLIAAAVGAATCLALSGPFLAAPGVRLEFDEDSPAPLPYTRGFYPPEGAGWPDSYAWTELDARVMLPDLPRSTPWVLTIRAHSAQPAGAAMPPVALTDHRRSLGQVVFTASGGAHYADVHVDLPVANERGLRLGIANSHAQAPTAGDARQLALQVDAIALTPGNRFAAIPWRRVLPVSAVMALVAGLLAVLCSPGAALCGGAAAALALGALGYLSSWLYLPTFDGLSDATWLAAAVLGAGLAVRGAWRIAPATAGPAIAFAVWFTVAKFGLVIHPSMTIGDSFFHQNRLAVVERGNYLFTSVAPGGEFPYPVAFYVAATHIGARPSIPVMRGLALVTDSIAGLLVALAVAAPAQGRRMLLGVLLWQTTPALFQPQALVYLTNSFGNSWSAIAGAFLIRGLRVHGAKWLLPATAAAVVASLAHVSSFVLLAASIGAAIPVAAAVRRWRTAVALSLVLAVTLGAAWFIYYRHFTALYAQRFQGAAVAEPAAAGPPATLPIQRYEAHQTAFVPGWPALRQRLAFVPLYVVKYVGVGLLGLALMAVWPWIRGSDRVDEAVIVALGIAFAVGGAFLLGQLTPIDLRYYLVAASLCAPIAAFAAARGESMNAPGQRGVTTALAAIAIAQGCWYMARFLWNPLPR
jgi:hypothetical protein